MKFFRLLIFVFVFSFIFNVNAQDDEPLFYYGIYAGYNHNIHKPDFKYIGDCANCGYFDESGSGSGFAIGGLFEYPVSKKFSPYIRIGYSVLNGYFSTTESIGYTELRNIDNNTLSVVKAMSEYSVDSKISAFTIEPGLNYYIIDRWNVSVGLNFSLLLNKTMTQQEELVSPENVVFLETGQLTRNVYDEIEIPGSKAFQLFLPIGTSYEFPLGNNSKISPEIKYYIPTAQVADVDWNISTLYLGANAKFGFIPSKEKPVFEEEVFERDTAVIARFGIEKPEIRKIASNTVSTTDETDDKIVITNKTIEKYEKLIPKSSRLEPGLMVRGITANGEIQDEPQIIIEEFETTESFPLLPYVFFKEGNAELDKTKMKLLTSDDAAQFNPEDLPENTMDIYENMLNIIAYRLQNRSKRRITITGANSNQGLEENNTELSLARAEAVKDYFSNVWGIPESQIFVKSRNLPENFANINKKEGIEENQRAEIYSSDYDIIAPIELMEIDKVANPPQIEIIPSVVNDSPIKKWDISIVQDNKELRSYTGKEIEKIIWELEDKPVPLTETPIDISFDVEDELGQKKKSDNQLSIQQLTIRKKRFEMKDDKRIERFALILFDYDKATIKSEHMVTLNDIKTRIKDNSNVIISGFADETGDPDYNRSLAARRTAEVQKVLNVPQDRLKINNVGSDKLLYDNNSPAGRSYCRTVTIEIETPVE
jgi:outer membrane protein OmpA-like peptidoglycan-associated protein